MEETSPAEDAGAAAPAAGTTPVNDPPVPNTPARPKSAIRYLHDTLFVLSFGSALLGLSKHPTHAAWPAAWVWPLAAFFVLFRTKAYFDDNASLRREEETVPVPKQPPPTLVAGVLVSIASWILYAAAGYSLFLDQRLSVFLLAVSFALYAGWIVVQRLLAGEAKEYHTAYFCMNVLYIGALYAVFTQHTPWCWGGAFALLVLLALDTWWTGTHGKLFE
jgi:hypothetical protein